MQFDTKGEVDSSSRRQEVGIIASDGMVKKKNMTVSCGRAEGRETVVWFLIHLNLHPSHVL